MDVMNVPFRKKFKGPGLALPPIDERFSSKLYEDASSPSTQSTLSSPQPFQSRTRTRRASIASFSSVKKEVKLQDLKAQIRRDSLKNSEIGDRRDSLIRRFEKLQMKTSKNTMPDTTTVNKKRRESIATIMPQGRRASFRSIGNKVTNLMRVRNAFNKGVRQRPTIDVEEEDIDKASEITELPKEPRFASTLSVEAQYAMMKGYEDIVYGYLSRSYPEYRPFLRRNRTPLAGVKVKVPEIIEESPRLFEDSDEESSKLETNDSETKSPIDKSGKDTIDGALSPTVSTKSPSSPNLKATNITPEYSSSMPDNKTGYNRELTPPYYRSLPSSVASQRNREAVSSLARYQSLPHLVPKDKQLVMTYRYHSAMDILDQIKKNIGLHATSPRVIKGCSSEPVRDFNLWSCVWNKEFEPVTAQTLTAKTC